MYTQQDTDNTDVFPLIASFVASGFGFSSGLEGATTGLFEDLLTGAAAVPSPADAEVPKAYLKYFIFNREMQMTQHGHELLDETALNNWQKLELEIPIQTNGYIYIYVANESMADVNVHFDDMEVVLIEGPAVNGADYYPFGLAMEGRSWSSEGYRFGYQGQFSEYDDETGWNAFELRMYDPVVGRWMAPDPYRQFYSPYVGIGNNPVVGIDPTGGDCPTCPKGSEFDAYRDNSALFAFDPSVGVYSDFGDIGITGNRFKIGSILFQHNETIFVNGYVPGGKTTKQTHSYTHGSRRNYSFEAYIQVTPETRVNNDFSVELTDNNLVTIWAMSTGNFQSSTRVSISVNGEIYTTALEPLSPGETVIHAHERHLGKVIIPVPSSSTNFKVKIDHSIWTEEKGGKWVPTWTALGVKPIKPSTGWIDVDF